MNNDVVVVIGAGAIGKAIARRGGRGAVRRPAHARRARVVALEGPGRGPVVGETRESHLEDAIGAFDVYLTAEDVAYLEEPYVPHAVVGHQ